MIPELYNADRRLQASRIQSRHTRGCLCAPATIELTPHIRAILAGSEGEVVKVMLSD